MERKTTSWQSTHLDRDMGMAIYGWFGKPLLLFPTAGGDHLEYENSKLLESLSGLIQEGKIKCYTLDSLHQETWLKSDIERADSAVLQNKYNEYVVTEVVPFIRKDCGASNLRIACGGIYHGAFQAANQVFRRPDLFDTLIAISGFYDLKPFLGGYMDDNCYFNSPQDFVRNLEDNFYLNVLQNNTSLNFLVGKNLPEKLKQAEDFCHVLERKSIPHTLDIWGSDVTNEWKWWNQMMYSSCDLLF